MKLLLNGFLVTNTDGNISLFDEKNDIYESSIPERIQDVFDYKYIDKGLGQRITYIPHCNLSIYYTKDACTFEEAQTALLLKLDGDMDISTSFTGYSEYTITGLDIDEFKIGEHDLEKELKSYLGEYCWISIET